ncbi:SGNH/GDSL hydrolase family protein [Lipingzhangella sp. LS1_29]|uniref:SGNH/GDSL hydrolase family protein n=1 Tax=Lipingzhangella rawalii TaxID=2055835 RepID=A0ABU2H7C7_9ACTN|nr:SGNH/GDSL hydrolase family protein [Lipingzhangella rawalii]MDS1271208.1 SGNH/GDSL hydrolase family protein [Lipingzhangella rawalii]
MIDLGRDRLTYVALGDSFTEGVGDPAVREPGEGTDAQAAADGGLYRGWADRFAEHLAAHIPEVHYANLAVRGKLLRQVLADQMPAALAMRPDLVTLCAGGNDLLRPGADPDLLAAQLERAVRRLRDQGCDVVLFTGVNIASGFMRVLLGRFARYYLNVRSIADRTGSVLVDQWSMSVLRDPRAWESDRLHMSAEGHRRVALRVCDTLGVPTVERWDEPWPAADPVDWRTARSADARWVGQFLLPWVGRRLSGRSSGDGVQPKRPDPTEVRSLPV